MVEKDDVDSKVIVTVCDEIRCPGHSEAKSIWFAEVSVLEVGCRAVLWLLYR